MATRSVVVTAGGSGLGLAIARAFAAIGDRVAICDVDAEAVRIVEDTNPAISGTVCDVRDRVAVGRFVDGAAAAGDGIDVVVSNAGIAGPTASVTELAPEDWDAVIAVNLTGAFNLARCAVPHLRKSASGSLIAISSVAGRYGYPNRSPYAASKWGLIGFVKSLAIELGDCGARANAILPGGVDGPRLRGVLTGRAAQEGVPVEQVVERALAVQSIKRFVSAEEVADLALYLASESARSITGQAISIDNDSSTA
jgi:NAD(P)-dependent dehydrogenase (short-subunit alcohol dehydrogenase family)